MTLKIPDDLASKLEQIAAAEHKTVEHLALEALRIRFEETMAPGMVLKVIRSLPHPSSAAVDELEAAIAAGRLTVRAEGAFDAPPSD